MTRLNLLLSAAIVGMAAAAIAAPNAAPNADSKALAVAGESNKAADPKAAAADPKAAPNAPAGDDGEGSDADED
jgi:hypothetical protein